MLKNNPSELILKKLFKNRLPQCIISVVDQTYYECHAGGPDEIVHNYCLPSKDNSHVLSDPNDTSPPSPSISIEKEECFNYILDKMIVNFKNGQVPWQCFMCGDTVPQVQYHTKCLFCSASMVDNAKLLLL